jgi:seryl-tRNA synthetase
MKRISYILVLLLALLGGPLSAQEKTKPDSTQNASGAERIQALKVAFISDRLKLTPAEAEKFWPVYNEYQDKREVVRKQIQENYQKIREGADKLSDEEFNKLSDEIVKLKQKEAEIQSEMHEKLKLILPAKKLALLYVAEEDFKREIVRILTEEKNKPKPPKDKQK